MNKSNPYRLITTLVGLMVQRLLLGLFDFTRNNEDTTTWCKTLSCPLSMLQNIYT